VSVEVVNVKVEDQFLDLRLGLETKRTVVDIWVIGSVSVESAIVSLIGIKNSSWNNLEVIKCLWKRRCSVNIPVCATIANHHTSKVDFV
jgi:hypothetical protein